MKLSYLTFTLLLLFVYPKNTSAQSYNSFYGSVVNNVSAANILADLTTFEGFGIKELGSTQLNNTKNWLVDRYQNLGYTAIEEQAFSVSGNTTYNVIVTKTGSLYPNTYVIIDAHYDTINGPGTNDNGSGTVLLLEMARLFANVDTEYSIKFIHFSGEELGLLGSNYYVNNTVNPENLDIKLVLNIDQVGGTNGASNSTIVCEEDRSNPSGNNAASSAVTQTLATCIELYSTLNTEISYAYGSDYVPFENNGEIITGLYEKNETPYSHTANDLLANMDPNYLFQVTKGALGAALEFAVSTNPLSIESNNINGDISVFPNPTSGNLNIQLTNALGKNTTLTTYNMIGKSVFATQFHTSNNVVDLSHLARGLYLAVIENGSQKTTKKIILN
ncbi:M28 family peptidase [Bizionia sp.]|uniref:M28 family peptidase n=1 Tax=Bizionia sp. TaxID=1954480 RepID=UPI003A8E04B6